MQARIRVFIHRQQPKAKRFTLQFKLRRYLLILRTHTSAGKDIRAALMLAKKKIRAANTDGIIDTAPVEAEDERA